MLDANAPSPPFGYVEKIDNNQGWPTEDLARNVWQQAQNGTLERLNPSQCIEEYAVNFATKRRNLILVTNDTDRLAEPRTYNNYNSAVMPPSIRCPSDPFDWICGQRGGDCLNRDVENGLELCPVAYKSIDRSRWEPLGNKVDHCLSEQVAGICKVQFSTAIAWTVIAFNLSKVILLLGIFFLLREDPLITMGDAVASFLERKDETTAGLCLMGRHQIALWGMPPIPQPYKSITRRWLDVVSKGRWWFCMFL